MSLDAKSFHIHGVQDGLEFTSDVRNVRGEMAGVIFAQIIHTLFFPVRIGRFRLPGVNLQQLRIVLPAHIKRDASRMPQESLYSYNKNSDECSFKINKNSDDNPWQIYIYSDE